MQEAFECSYVFTLTIGLLEFEDFVEFVDKPLQTLHAKGFVDGCDDVLS